MNKLINRLITAAAGIICGLTALAGSFTAGKGTFLLNGEPIVVKAAELHYPRIPRPYWDQRIKQCKALGTNACVLERA